MGAMVSRARPPRSGSGRERHPGTAGGLVPGEGGAARLGRGLVDPAADAVDEGLAAGGLGVAHARDEPQLLRFPGRHVQLARVLGREVVVLVTVHDQSGTGEIRAAASAGGTGTRFQPSGLTRVFSHAG